MSDEELLQAVGHFESDLRRFKAELKRRMALAQAAQMCGGAFVDTVGYEAPPEQWRMPSGETCIQYGPEDGPEPEIDA